MAHHQRDIRLGERDVQALGDDSAYEFVVDLAGHLLDADAGMAVKLRMFPSCGSSSIAIGLENS